MKQSMVLAKADGARPKWCIMKQLMVLMRGWWKDNPVNGGGTSDLGALLPVCQENIGLKDDGQVLALALILVRAIDAKATLAVGANLIRWLSSVILIVIKAPLLF